MILGTGIFLIGSTPVSFSSYNVVLETGVFEITSSPVTFTTKSSMVLGTGIFTITGGNMAIYGACQQGNVIDTLAADAPYPPADFFTPVTSAQPDRVLSPDEVFGTSSPIYVDYYSADTQTWDDNAYQTQYPGLMIPPELKQEVSDQTYLYNQYVAALALWEAEYDRQKLFQWPYYWAQNVAIATGSTPGGTKSCGCSCDIPLSGDTIAPASQTVLGGSAIFMDDKFDIGGTEYTTGQIFAMVLKNLAQP